MARMSLFLSALIWLFATPALAETWPLCTGVHRAERHVTCVVDADTLWVNGVKYRVAGIDAPEKGREAECRRERRLARLATARFQTLLRSGKVTLKREGVGFYHRPVARVFVDGRDVGAILMAEGHAQPWPNHGNPWCAQ